MNIASLIFRPDLGFLALTSFQSFNRPSLSFGSSSRISLRRQSFSVSRPRLRPPGNIHNRSLLLLTNKIRPRLAATSFDDFAIAIPHRPNIESFARFNKMILEAINGRYLTGGCLLSASLFAGLFLSLQHIRLTAVGFAIFRKRSEISASESAPCHALSLVRMLPEKLRSLH